MKTVHPTYFQERGYVDFTAVVEETDGQRQVIARNMANVADAVLSASRALHSRPELSFAEHEAAGSLTAVLTANGMPVELGVGELPTAFVATAGTGSFVVGFCAEYDALPEVGHACGHNLIAGSSIAAALSLLPLVDDLNLTVKVIGTPAEEHGGGKALLLDRGIFEGLSAAMMIHPLPQGRSYNPAGTSSQVVGRYSARFQGQAAHAAAAPHLGVNAGDAAVLTQAAIGLLRQQIPDDHRVASFIASAGSVTNIIPDEAVVNFECRTFTRADFEDLLVRVRRCFEAGALATGATLEIQNVGPVYDALLQDLTLSEHWCEAMSFFGKDVSPSPTSPGGSTDMGNVSQSIPSIHPRVGIPGVHRFIPTPSLRPPTPRPHIRSCSNPRSAWPGPRHQSQLTAQFAPLSPRMPHRTTHQTPAVTRSNPQ